MNKKLRDFKIFFDLVFTENEKIEIKKDFLFKSFAFHSTVSIFIDCENSQIAGSHRGKIIKPHCSNNCFCAENVGFMPVCPERGVQTYYSPCHGEFYIY